MSTPEAANTLDAAKSLEAAKGLEADNKAVPQLEEKLPETKLGFLSPRYLVYNNQYKILSSSDVFERKEMAPKLKLGGDENKYRSLFRDLCMTIIATSSHKKTIERLTRAKLYVANEKINHILNLLGAFNAFSTDSLTFDVFIGDEPSTTVTLKLKDLNSQLDEITVNTFNEGKLIDSVNSTIAPLNTVIAKTVLFTTNDGRKINGICYSSAKFSDNKPGEVKYTDEKYYYDSALWRKVDIFINMYFISGAQEVTLMLKLTDDERTQLTSTTILSQMKTALTGPKKRGGGKKTRVRRQRKSKRSKKSRRRRQRTR